jgi:DNA-binding transcriptional ArsR family regulator
LQPKNIAPVFPPQEANLDAELLAQICKALAHPARIKILNYLQTVNRCICGDIVEQLPLAQSTVSQHLKHLKAAGLIQGEIEGPRTCYCVDQSVLEKFKQLAKKL